jgi:hypothetical protein
MRQLMSGKEAVVFVVRCGEKLQNIMSLLSGRFMSQIY